MFDWEQANSSEGRTFTRRLGPTEAFYWDSQFDRAADSLQFVEAESTGSESHSVSLFDIENVRRTWKQVKKVYPLLSARAFAGPDNIGIFFQLTEKRLWEVGPEEIHISTVNSSEEARYFAHSLITTERQLSDHLLARLYVLRHLNHPNKAHVIFHAAHCVTDGTSNNIFLSTFLELLSSSSQNEEWNLEHQLAFAIPCEHRMPTYQLPLPRRRWKYAMGQVISSLRSQKLSGGHTLPRKFTKMTPYTPASSGSEVVELSPETSVIVVRNCKKLGMTFGNVYPVLAQVAFGRLLCKRYVAGHIGEDEWDYRRKEPMVHSGPLNMRPYLSKLRDRTGFAGIGVAVCYYFYTLPFMPLGSASRLKLGDPVPSFSELLSFDRFLLRARSIRQQAVNYINHPLFLDIARAQTFRRLEQSKHIALRWQSGIEVNSEELTAKVPVQEQACEGYVMAHGGSSFGNMDAIIAQNYPRKAKEGSPLRIKLLDVGVILHSKSDQLYLGAATLKQRLCVHSFWDRNVYSDAVVTEWLEEVKSAIEHYLGSEIGDCPNLYWPSSGSRL
ncbi:hypothetical protein AMATHDRAFT_196205 [Amanita thiersii Skay4041]|uniref:Condensation domain-containing protein n=1 Tax=Amanita thiersii Skay4041 TaxID=703135 RepID=A0A2A9NKA4_9AGAR|nr:hypothetical protein AMATHDRAFT_196205 [Amanita thiersii Skay4041]